MPGGAAVLLELGGPGWGIVCPQAEGVPLQERLGDLQLLLLQQHPGCAPQPSAPGRLPRGKPLHTQHTRHEGDAHNPRDSPQPERPVCPVHLQRELLPCLPRLGQDRGGPDLRRLQPPSKGHDPGSRQSTGGAGVQHCRNANRHRVREGHSDPGLQRVGRPEAVRVSERHEKVREHLLAVVQRGLSVPVCLEQH
uniref:Uncharacterized protein n=1 Tax=Ixodes ricinus TaxID=34613 RepID=A0A6B0V0N7_IXORI